MAPLSQGKTTLKGHPNSSAFHETMKVYPCAPQACLSG